MTLDLTIRPLESGAHEDHEAACVMDGLPESFVARIRREGECWMWTGPIMHRGYGHYSFGRKPVRAHRFAYQRLKGSIPPGLVLDHLCRNRACVNPAHLEAVTPAENLRRSPIAPATINARKTHCPKGHEYAGDNLLIRGGSGIRECRACGREEYRRYRARKRAERSAAQ